MRLVKEIFLRLVIDDPCKWEMCKTSISFITSPLLYLQFTELAQSCKFIKDYDSLCIIYNLLLPALAVICAVTWFCYSKNHICPEGKGTQVDMV